MSTGYMYSTYSHATDCSRRGGGHVELMLTTSYPACGWNLVLMANQSMSALQVGVGRGGLVPLPHTRTSMLGARDEPACLDLTLHLNISQLPFTSSTMIGLAGLCSIWAASLIDRQPLRGKAPGASLTDY